MGKKPSSTLRNVFAAGGKQARKTAGTKVNVILSLKCKEAHSQKKPGIALDAAGSA
jgi:hypothetical protein